MKLGRTNSLWLLSLGISMFGLMLLSSVLGLTYTKGLIAMAKSGEWSNILAWLVTIVFMTITVKMGLRRLTPL